VTAGIFLITRSLAEGVRVFAISIVISIILHTAGPASIAVIILLTLFYTFEGGMTAVIWTDVIQMGMYVVGAAVSYFILVAQIPGGLTHALSVAGAAGKLQVFDFQWSWTAKYSFWAGIVGGCFLTTASHGTDQLVVQRLLSAKNQSQSRKALFASWFVIFVQFTLFLTIGMLLWVLRGGKTIEGPADRLYPSFIWDSFPPGVAGLAMAAIIAAAMANLSAALNSLASATVVDFYQPMTGARHSAAHYLKVSRLSTVAWGAVLAAIAGVSSQWGSVLESGLSIASVTLGILLGVFLLGVLTRRTGENAAIAGVVAGSAVMLFVKFATAIPFTWWVLIGSLATFSVGYAASFVIRERRTA
jgi:Na+/proline symporter